LKLSLSADVARQAIDAAYLEWVGLHARRLLRSGDAVAFNRDLCVLADKLDDARSLVDSNLSG
jgi:hypothetical protein